MNIQGFLTHLGLEIKRAGSQLQVDCPSCDDDKKHLYIAPGNGVGYCHKCSWAPNPYKLAEKVTTKTPAEIMKMLEEFGLNDSENSVGPSTPLRSAQDKLPEKKLALNREDIRDLTDDEKQSFCRIKQIDMQAFEKFKPYAHREKPWVLLPAYDPTETNKACGWLRCAVNGEPIELTPGKLVKYPIIAGSRHGLFGLPELLKDDPEKIIFTEAWRDMAACLAIGLNATASSGGASTWRDEWLAFFEGKVVYIAMDSDIPGQKAAQRAAEKISTVAKEVRIVSLPYEMTKDHGKDVHDYISENGKDFLLLLSKAKRFDPSAANADSGQVPECAEGVVMLADDHPDTIAMAFIKQSEIAYCYNSIDGWSVCVNNRYERVEDDKEVGVYIRRFLMRCYYQKPTKDGSKTVRVRSSNSRVRDVMGSMAALEGVHIRPELNAPSSLTGKFDLKQTIAMRNCLLDISGETPKELGLSEELYTFNYLEFDYDEDADCPQWLKFLSEIFTIKTDSAEWDEEKSDFLDVYKTKPDEEAINILQEWFGYFITADTHLQKIFGLIGPRRSGKSTIGKVIRALIGAKNTASPTLTSLATEFGLQPLLNKTIAIIGDANISGKASDVTRAVERLKSISGEDSQQINRKNKAHVEVGKLMLRFLIIANEMQDLRDSSGALASRFNFLVTTESFLNKEDMQLEEKLLKELPGIFNWALEGLSRLRERGYLIEHKASEQSRDEFEAVSSPMTAFVTEWCDIGPGQYVPVEALWLAHCHWCRSNGRGDGFSKQRFALKIKSVVPGIVKERRRIELSTLGIEYSMDTSRNDNRVNVYTGIDLKEDYKKRVDNADTVDKGWTG